MEEKILEILKNTLELETVDHTCSQATCEKWDSMAQLNLVVELETEFCINIEPEEISELQSFEDIVRIVSEKQNSQRATS